MDSELIQMIFPIFTAGIVFIVLLKTVLHNKLIYPLDFGIKLRGKRLFGDNKTIRGLIFMPLLTMIFGILTYFLTKSFANHKISAINAMVYYFFVGLAYSLGELPNSFIKRQLSITPGNSHRKNSVKNIFKIIDTFDSLIVVGIVYILLFHFSTINVLLAIFIGGILHLCTDQLMIKLNLKKKIND